MVLELTIFSIKKDTRLHFWNHAFKPCVLQSLGWDSDGAELKFRLVARRKGGRGFGHKTKKNQVSAFRKRINRERKE